MSPESLSTVSKPRRVIIGWGSRGGCANGGEPERLPRRWSPSSIRRSDIACRLSENSLRDSNRPMRIVSACSRPSMYVQISSRAQARASMSADDDAPGAFDASRAGVGGSVPM